MTDEEMDLDSFSVNTLDKSSNLSFLASVAGRSMRSSISIADKSMPSCKSVASSTEISLDEYTRVLRLDDVICSTEYYPSPSHPGNDKMMEDIKSFVVHWGNSGPEGREDILRQIRDLVEKKRGGLFVIDAFLHDTASGKRSKASSAGMKCKPAKDDEIRYTILDGIYKHFTVPLRSCDILFPTGFEPNTNYPGNVMMRMNIDHILQRCGPRYDDQILIDIKNTIMGQDGNPLFLYEGYMGRTGTSLCRRAEDIEIHQEIRAELQRQLVPRLPNDYLCLIETPNETMRKIVKGFVVKWGDTRPEGRDAILVEIRRAIEGQNGNDGSSSPRFLIPVLHDVEGTYCRHANDEEFKREISRIWPRYFSIPLRPVDVLCPRGNYVDCNHPGNVKMREIVFGERYNWADAGPKRRKELLESIRTRIVSTHDARFLFQGRQDDGDVRYCREAFPGEVEGEIESELRSYFNLIPTERDYIFGGGAIAQWKGNVFFRERLLDPRRMEYSSAAPAQKKIIVDEVYNAIVNCRGRFLYAWDSRPFHGLMEEPKKDHIKIKLGNALREKRGMNKGSSSLDPSW